MKAELVSNIGRLARIRYEGVVCVGNVVDLVAGTDQAKRIRLQYGQVGFDLDWKGKVVMPGEYEFLEWGDEE